MLRSRSSIWSRLRCEAAAPERKTRGCSPPRPGSSRPAGRRRFIALAFLLPVLAGCDVLSTESPSALVPPTADQDPLLPQLRVSVAGRERALHLQSFGDPRNPTALVLPGGPAGDHRLMLPLRALAERYHVVIWTPRGAGLSERVSAEELALDGFVEEIAAVRAAVAPQQTVTLIGHSHGAGLFLRYAVAHPDAVDQLVLIEPGPLTAAGRPHYRGGAVGWADGQDFFWQNEFLSSRDHAAADYKAVSLLPYTFRSFSCSGEPIFEFPMWRFGSYHYHVLTHGRQAPGRSFDWTEGVEEVPADLVVVAGTCGAAGAAFQEAYNMPALQGAQLAVVTGAGHITLFTTHAEALLDALRVHLAAFR
jgi:proline iminopeptidase